MSAQRHYLPVIGESQIQINYVLIYISFTSNSGTGFVLNSSKVAGNIKDLY